jgi:hypothetical protein
MFELRLAVDGFLFFVTRVAGFRSLTIARTERAHFWAACRSFTAHPPVAVTTEMMEAIVTVNETSTQLDPLTCILTSN